MGNNKKYWKGLEDLHNDPDYIKSAQNEFAEELPIDFLGKNKLAEGSTPRRDFLKFLGFSVTAASLAACETPVRKVIPYVIKPEDVTPGVPNWYATTYYDGHDYASILVKNRDGRPIKIEGNKKSSVTRGGTSARVQAAVLSLYDSARISGPLAKGSPSSWSTVDKAIGAGLISGGNTRILTSTIISPSSMKAIQEFITRYPNTKHVVYDAISYSGMLDANKASFGKRVIPTYNFDKASVIVSLGADFLANWISPIEHAAQYVVNRKLGGGKKDMSKHIQIETNLTVTGSNADLRIPAKPSEIGQAAASLLAAVGGNVSSKATSFDAKLKEVAKELNNNKGKALVVCGSNDVNVQILVNAINQAIGAYGTTINLDKPSYLKQGNDAEVINLVNEMKSGNVQTLIMHQVNPSYTLPASLGFDEALKKVKLKVSFADRADETASQCDYICPDHHILESWGDAMPAAGSYSLIQPVIFPLFNTRAAEESLLKWAGNETDYQTYVKKNWETGVFTTNGGGASFNDFWSKSLFDGVVETDGKSLTYLPAQESSSQSKGEAHSEAVTEAQKASTATEPVKTEEATAAPTANAQDLNAVVAALPKAGAGFELYLYEKTGIGNGVQANNPWLQELPDPISRVTWDNYVTMNPADMREKGYNLMERADRYATLIEVSANGITVELPVYPSPGQTKGTIGIALGYGRTKAGKAANEVGKNLFPASAVVNSTFSYVVPATLSEGKGEFEIAATQTHHTMMGRSVVHETTLSEYQKDPKSGNHTEKFKLQLGQEHTEHTARELDLWATEKYPGHDKPIHFWGMSIDLNACIGCGACVVSCNAENNVPVVGKKEVAMSRDMHWIRIDRYFSSDADPVEGSHESKHYTEMENPSDYPQVVFQPLMCMHCNHAPCETVCPVAATMHSSDGLNQMAYNRCVGTRYCANNCPYKVRRFNWFKYSDNAEFDFNMNDDLGKMVLNPDVVVRSRGVMEKCSMCVQRIQEGKLNAKKDGRKIIDGEIQTACAQACPTNAIIFGDYNDKESQLSKAKEDERVYHLLEEINTQPSVFYLTKVRNAEDTTPVETKHHA